MTAVEIIAQIFGLVGMFFNAGSYQQKRQERVLICQFFGTLCFAINFFMLGAFIGGMLNVIGNIRAILFYFKDKTKANSPWWLLVFSLVFAATYPMTFLVFGTEPTLENFIIEILPVIAMIVITVSLKIGSAKAVRFLGIIASPLWLVYNCIQGSIGAIACEILNLISIVVGIIRFDIKRHQTPSTHE